MDFTACAAIVERADPDRFDAAMSAPLSAREVLFPLYAFNTEVVRAPWVSSETMIAEMRLQFWRDTVDEIAAGKKPRAHEVAQPLAEVIRTHDLSAALFDELIVARQWDIYKDAFEDEAHFARYIDRTAGNLMWLAALALGARQQDEASIRVVAYAGGIASFLQAIPALEAAGRIPLLDGRAEGVQDLAQDALDRIKGVQISKAISPAARSAWLAKPLLKMAIANPQRVADGTLQVSEATRRGRLAWAAMRSSW